MRHEPCCLECYTQGPVQLVTADALLAAGHKIDSLQPKVQLNVAAFKDRTHADCELLATVFAFLEAVGAQRLLDAS